MNDIEQIAIKIRSDARNLRRENMIDKMPPRTWDEEADIIIVGSGFAGLAAAIEAKSGLPIKKELKLRGIQSNTVCGKGL